MTGILRVPRRAACWRAITVLGRLAASLVSFAESYRGPVRLGSRAHGLTGAWVRL